MGEKEEQYYVFNVETKMYLKGFKRTAALWVDDIKKAAYYPELEALRLQRKLEKGQFTPRTIRLIEKK